jgi:DNA-binding response OmpR family regulator
MQTSSRGERRERTMETVLVVEDSRALQRTLQRLFEGDSLQVRIAGDGIAALEMFKKQMPDVVVLDLKLPSLSGKELCREFKAMSPSIPIVVLSANSEVEDKVLLLELGADDYVTKPFSPRELLARVRRAMRRTKPTAAGRAVANPIVPEVVAHETLSFADIEVDFTSMEAARSGKALTLTAHEFKLLKFLALSPGRVISREELLDQVWGYDNYPTTRTVDNYILRLRQKLEPDPAKPQFFLTIHGAGYKFVLGGIPAEIES